MKFLNKETNLPAQLVKNSLALVSLLYLLKTGLKIQNNGENNDLNDIELEDREKKVGDALKRILGDDVVIEYENYSLIYSQPGKERSSTTNPDFYFQFQGIHIFVEAGGNKNTPHKKKQKKVIKNGLETPGKKPTKILYVQLFSRDISRLKKIKNPEQLLRFFLKKYHLVHNLNVI